jgi:predicted nucleic acid-binding protein
VTYLLDTNFVIGLLRGVQSYWERLDRLVEEAVPAISAVTRSEIFAGCHPHEERATQHLLDHLETIPVHAPIADLAGKYVYRFRHRGFVMHLEDALIGASAVLRGFIVITRNVDHFPMLTLGQNLLRFPV